MRLNDAVHDVTGEIFRDGWSRIRGSMQGLQAGRQKQLVRAAAGHRAAVFKAIRGGGHAYQIAADKPTRIPHHEVLAYRGLKRVSGREDETRKGRRSRT